MIVVVREDLTPAYQAVQGGHALAQFCLEHSKIANSWHKNSNYLVYLSVRDENELMFLIDKAQSRDIAVSVFREPDIENQITAIALEPSGDSKKICKKLPCALMEYSSKGMIDKHSKILT